MKMFGMCINKRVVIGLVGVGLLVWVLAPEVLMSALPLLLLAVCPLSMVVMMKMMSSGNGQGSQDGPAPTTAASPRPDGGPAAAAQTSQPSALIEPPGDSNARRN